VDLESNGYVVIDIDRYRARGEWYRVDNVRNPDSAQALIAAVEVANGDNHISRVFDNTGLATQCAPPARTASVGTP
jgi:hypothetical protein